MRWAFFLAITATLALASSAWSQSPADRAQARTHADAGLKHFKAGEYDEAIAELSKAEKLVHAPPHLLYIARSHHKSGRLGEARTTYRAILDEKLDPKAPAAFHKAQ